MPPERGKRELGVLFCLLILDRYAVVCYNGISKTKSSEKGA